MLHGNAITPPFRLQHQQSDGCLLGLCYVWKMVGSGGVVYNEYWDSGFDHYLPRWFERGPFALDFVYTL
jgi:hypothetical protein